MKSTRNSTCPQMEDIFQAMKHCENAHAVRLSLAIFPVQAATLHADFGMAVKVYNLDGKLIREISHSYTYWPSRKYVCWEAAALACIYSVEQKLTEEYMPLIAAIEAADNQQ